MNVFQENRQALYQSLDDNSLLLLYSGARKQQSADEDYPFIVNMNFYYLTGINQDNVYLLVSKSKKEIKESLFIAENDPRIVKWVGASLYKEEAIELSAVKDVHYLNELDNCLEKEIKNAKVAYLDQEKVFFEGQKDFAPILEEKLLKLKKVEIKDCYPLITRLRGVKKPYEIELFRKDVELTKLALEKVLEHLDSCEYEYQAQAIFEAYIKYYGNAKVSFTTIAASGVNGATLHYSENTKKLDKNDLILLDLGANCNLYHADISRTYPLSGKFNDLQKKIYTIVLDCNKHIINNIKPGVSILELQQMTVNFLADGCLKTGLIKDKEEIKNYYFHGISHHIGLDTHDPYPDYKEPLRPGMIISCEPGLYFENLGIGVRIEDDILVTEDGCDNLSKDIIKEIKDIEEYIQKHQKR